MIIDSRRKTHKRRTRQKLTYNFQCRAGQQIQLSLRKPLTSVNKWNISNGGNGFIVGIVGPNSTGDSDNFTIVCNSPGNTIMNFSKGNTGDFAIVHVNVAGFLGGMPGIPVNSGMPGMPEIHRSGTGVYHSYHEVMKKNMRRQRKLRKH